MAALNHQLQDRNIFLAEICDMLLQAQNLMKAAHDKSHRPLEFAIGDLVWLHMNQRAAISVRDGPLSKPAPKYYGLYRIGGLTYRLQLPARARIHDVFQIAFLKKYNSKAPAVIPPVPPIVLGHTVPQPQQVVRAQPTAHSWDLLVKWQDSSPAEASWEQLEAFKEAYLDFQLEDKLFEPEGVMSWTHTWRNSIVEGRRVRQMGPTVANKGPPAVITALSRVS
jgi:hypothetical protein